MDRLCLPSGFSSSLCHTSPVQSASIHFRLALYPPSETSLAPSSPILSCFSFSAFSSSSSVVFSGAWIWRDDWGCGAGLNASSIGWIRRAGWFWGWLTGREKLATGWLRARGSLRCWKASRIVFLLSRSFSDGVLPGEVRWGTEMGSISGYKEWLAVDYGHWALLIREREGNR